MQSLTARLAGPFDIVLADPPYDLAAEALVDVLLGLPWPPGLLAAHADLIVERSRGPASRQWPEPLVGVRVKKYGDTLLCYGRAP